ITGTRITGTNLKGVHKGMTITDGSVRMEGGEINFKGDYGVYLNQGMAALIAVKMTYTGNNNKAEFIRIVGEDTTNAMEKTGKVQKMLWLLHHISRSMEMVMGRE
ncbi:hypothetical protein, partial [Bartonella bovis]|uniref:hypothetical protein n=1 Tax=Bartonella bovis TaxID=155194 RepID=UPI0005535920